ncbi:type II toxin-antitoxin system death-on-curing family toxin [Streptococcus pneumoniae]|uniref:type II toxin-antitoxin system death-on-curing family toxin n=1 Tax=Streptococcus pneumoniae TaxID=1313 RepID=UPI000B5914A0|nr:type II toxin-antitoxin system death-on-curing family toxin [Streptococcus pneumoniae]TVW93803.1 type II toxin-antitoxin system death-on-curing family toxin [Streptococcus pneumoniae]SNJ58920.1 Death on curing protein [Streptococcus pneumoniae]SNJ60299.1 phosphoribosylaminoimidazole-succinocarboxamide synthetase [Streptococcus pneumoniae]
MKRLTTEQVLALHRQLIVASGGMDGIRDKGLVESSLSNVFDTYFEVEQYLTIEEKEARLCYSLIKNHAFLDGNKRIGIFVMLVLLEINDIVLDCTDEELVHLGLGVATSKLTYEDILDFVKNH